MPAPRNDALARFVLSPTKRANGRSLDQQWDELAAFMKGPGSVLARLTPEQRARALKGLALLAEASRQVARTAT